MAIKADTNMKIRINREVKQQAQQIFADLGMDIYCNQCFLETGN